MPESTEKILVRGLNRLGDAVMSTPALQRLREAKPNAHITLLSPEKLGGLWQGQPFLDEVLTFSATENVMKVGSRLCQKNFQTALLFPNSIRSAIEVWLAKIPRRIGIARPGRGFFLNRALPSRAGAVAMHKRSDGEIRDRIASGATPGAFPAAAHQLHDYLYLTAELGASAEPLLPRIFISDEQGAQALRQLRLEPAPAGRPWFGLNPGAEYGPAKRWPAKRFAAAAALLHKQTQCRWLVFGGPDELELAEKVTTEIRYAVAPDAALNLAGKTTLPELAAALKICRLLLTNDTGPMHLAAAVGTPLIALFGSTSPELTGPGYSPSAQIVRTPPPCAPCFRRECPVDMRCLNEITIGQVVEAARRILDT